MPTLRTLSPQNRFIFQAEEMKDKLSLMTAESREEGQEEVESRLEKTRLAAGLFDQAGTRAAAVSGNGTPRCGMDRTQSRGCHRQMMHPRTLSGTTNRALFRAGCTDDQSSLDRMSACPKVWPSLDLNR